MSYTTLVGLLQGSYWFILLIAFIMRLLIADKFSSIAVMKGHDSHFGWCFFLGIVGYLMVIALPDLNARPKEPPKEYVPPIKQYVPETINQPLTKDPVIKPITEEEKRIQMEKAAKVENILKYVLLYFIAAVLFIILFILVVRILETSGLVFI